MASLKDQLVNVKKLLRSWGSKESRDDKSGKVDFEPPEVWLTGDGSKKATVERPKGQSKAAPIPAPVDRWEAHSPRGEASKGPEPIRQPIPSSSTKPKDSGAKPVPPVEVTPDFRPRIDPGRSFKMPEWISLGKSLQQRNQQGQKAAPMIVRIGVDFGTAFTKVAIRAGADLVTVDWLEITGDESPTGRFVMPGLVIRGRNGEYSWRRDSGSEVLGNLKLPIIEKVGSDECPIATLAFLALVIRYARAFLYRHPEVGRKLEARSPRWELNIGCPTQPHENPEVVESFRVIARTAWRLAAESRLDESVIVALWRDQSTDTGLEVDPGVIPEFVAQIAGYLQSPRVNEGLHALVDVGAATLDVAAFNVVKNNERASDPNWRIPIFFPTVRPLGTHYLNHNRHYLSGLPLQWDDTEPPAPLVDFASENGKSVGDLERIDQAFQEEVVKCILNVIDGTRTNNRGVGIQHSAWRQGLPCFLTGGGSDVDLYIQAIKQVESRLATNIRQSLGVIDGGRFRLISVPLEFAETGASKESVHRLSVAIGLTEGSEDDIAKIISFRHSRPFRKQQRKQLQHEEIYGDG